MADIKRIIEEISCEYFEENGFVLWDTEFEKEGRDWFLRVFVDKADAFKEDAEEVNLSELAGGSEEEMDEEEIEGNWSEAYVSTDDCEKISQFLSDKLDELDPIEQEYYLEVSSPGLDRKLFKPEHFMTFAGQIVDVKLKVPYSGLTLDDGTVLLKGETSIQGVLTGLENVEGEKLVITKEVDTKAKNRKPGAKISPKALQLKNLVFNMDTVSEVRLAVIF